MALCDEKCRTFGHTVSVFSQVCLQFSSRVVRHGFDVKSCCGLPGTRESGGQVIAGGTGLTLCPVLRGLSTSTREETFRVEEDMTFEISPSRPS